MEQDLNEKCKRKLFPIIAGVLLLLLMCDNTLSSYKSLGIGFESFGCNMTNFGIEEILEFGDDFDLVF